MISAYSPRRRAKQRTAEVFLRCDRLVQEPLVLGECAHEMGDYCFVAEDSVSETHAAHFPPPLRGRVRVGGNAAHSIRLSGSSTMRLNSASHSAPSAPSITR